MTITITKTKNVLNDKTRNELYKALESIRYEYSGLASSKSYEINKEYEFKNDIGTVKVTFTLEDLI